MSRNKASTDGFVPRTPRQSLGEIKAPSQKQNSKPTLDSAAKQPEVSLDPLPAAEADFEISFDDLEASEKEEITKKRRWWQRKKKDKPKKSKFRRYTKRFVLFSSLVVVSYVGFVGMKAFLAARNIIDRNSNCPVVLCDQANAEALRGEGDGRVNILLVGIGGENHDGGDLADTIIVASIDPIAKEASMLSVPRDLYVDIPNFGSSRINAAHAFGEQYGFTETGYPEGGVGLLQQTVEQTLDIPIHYYLRIDFQAFREAVDSVDGIDVTLEEALYDPTFWWEFGILDLAPGEHTLDGETALMFVRSRKTSARGDFDRNQRQRDVLFALQEKVLSLGTFSDPRKIVSLIDSLGSNVRTNIQISEMLRLYEIGSEMSSDKVVSTGLGDNEFLSGANIDGASVLVPNSGSFIEIQEFVRSIFIDGFIRSEQAAISVLSGVEVAGTATAQSELLESYGYNVVTVDNAPTADYTETVLFDVSDGSKPFTKQLLEQRYGTSMRSESFLPEGVIIEGVDFVIIVGSDKANDG